MYRKNSEIIYMVKEQTDAHLISKDSGFSDEQIFKYLLDVRNLLISRKFRDHKEISEINLMTTPCLKLIEAKSCPCVIPDNCIALMTEQHLPNNLTGLVSVTNVYGDKEYQPVNFNFAKYRFVQRKTSFRDKVSYFELNEHGGLRLFIITEKPLKDIKVTFIPQYPEEVQRMKDCNGYNEHFCTSTLDLEWVCDPELTTACIQETTKYLLGTKLQVTDIMNDNVNSNVNNKKELD